MSWNFGEPAERENIAGFKDEGEERGHECAQPLEAGRQGNAFSPRASGREGSPELTLMSAQWSRCWAPNLQSNKSALF